MDIYHNLVWTCLNILTTSIGLQIKSGKCQLCLQISHCEDILRGLVRMVNS